MIETGSASAGMMVADTRRTNRKMTSTTSTTVSPSVCCTSATAARIGAARSLRSVERTDRRVRAGGGQGALHFIEPDATDREQVGIDLNADGVFLLAEDEDLRDPRQRRHALPDIDLGVFVDGGQRQVRRGER